MYNKTRDRDNLRNWEITGVVAAVIIVLSLPVYYLKTLYFKPLPADKPRAAYVGRDKCKDCHKEVYKKWTNSHHDRAMDQANEETVLGNFNDAVFEYNGITTHFYRKNSKFMVHTQGPDGQMGDFEVTHTFGFYPLQQYLIPFPGGRLQCLSIAWDVENKKWYPLPNYTDDPEDWLHWTKAGQNWNGMCAECHSTQLKKGYNYKTDTYNTTWFEIDVSCEACHGPGSRHVAWADRPDMAREETENYDLVVDTSDIKPRNQVELCAPCHSRRSFLSDYDITQKDIMNSLIPQLLREGYYYPDGQILDEVYVYGSFVQSMMYQKGVKCSDCHDVHSLKLHKEGNALCLQCHREEVYDTKDHHFHKKIYKGKPSDGDDCVKCHMPGTDYMGIDNRADHSIRIPRPDLSVLYTIPNSCNTSTCHDDKSYEWSVEHMKKWYGIKKKPHFGMIFAEAREGKQQAQTKLIKLADDHMSPLIVRATALSLLNLYPLNDETLGALTQALNDDEAIIRYTAVFIMNQLDYDKKEKLIIPLLYDPVKAVHIEAALCLSALPDKKLNSEQQKIFESVLSEYQKSMEYAADFAPGRHNLGIMFANLGNQERALEHYKAALKIDSQFFPAKNNLALLYNKMGKNSEAESLLREIVQSHPEFYETAYSLALLLAEEKKYNESLMYMQKASKGLPNHTRLHYNLGLLLQHMGRPEEAETALLTALTREPDNMDFLYALADHYLKRGKFIKAKQVAERIRAKNPSNPLGTQMIEYINKMLRFKE